MKRKIEKLLKIAMWTVVITFVIICWLAVAGFSETISAYSLFGHAGEAIGLTVLVVFAYEKWLWKKDPTVNDGKYEGRYKGQIVPQGGEKKISANLDIKQSFLFVEIVMFTEESRSRTITGVSEEILGVQELIYTYLNEPKAGVREKSKPHFGTARLFFNNEGALCGVYYTDRNTTGDMFFEKMNKENGNK